MSKEVLVSLSGGMDSSTVLGQVRRTWLPEEVLAVSFSYGSKHNPYENEAARNVAKHYGVELLEFDLTSIVGTFNSNLLKSSNGEIPEGHYEQANMNLTVVPGRNMIFISILAGVAWSRNIPKVYVGIHSGDHAIYPDCRPEFFAYMRGAARLGTDNNVTIEAPHLRGNKTTIIREGLRLGVPYGYTRTCYKNQPIACGKCGACCERREAFLANGSIDPVSYEYSGPLPEKPVEGLA